MGIAFEKALPGVLRDYYEDSLKRLNYPTSTRKLAVMTYLIFVVTFVLLFMSILKAGVSPLVGIGDLAASLLPAIGLPLIWLRTRVSAWRTAVARGLPKALDLIAIAVAAGMVVDQAVQRVAERIAAPLGPEMLRAAHAIELGQRREIAWEEFADRLQAPDVARFVNSLTQAQQLGSSLSGELHSQAQKIRNTYKNQLKGRVARASVAMVIPVIFLVLPAIWIAVLGPEVYSALSGGL